MLQQGLNRFPGWPNTAVPRLIVGSGSQAALDRHTLPYVGDVPVDLPGKPGTQPLKDDKRKGFRLVGFPWISNAFSTTVDSTVE